MKTALTSPLRSGLVLAAFAGATAVAAAVGARTTVRPRNKLWYRTLRKAPYNPPDAAFGPVWSVLYGLSALSGWRVWRAPASPARTRALALWGVQLGLNAAWTELFFGQKRKGLAMADLAGLFTALALYARTAHQVDRPAAYMVGPYLAWVGFAGALNGEIVRRNP